MHHEEPQVGFSEAVGTIFRSAWQRFKWLIILGTLLALMAGLMQAAAPKLLQRLIDTLIANPQEESLRTVWILTALIAGASLLGIFAKFFTSKISFYIATQTEDWWKYHVLEHYYHLPHAWHDQQDSGQAGMRIERGAGAIYSVINELFGNELFVSMVTLVVVLTAAVIQAPGLWWVFVLPIPIYITFTYFISKRIAAKQDELNNLSDEANRSFFDGISNVRSVKAFGKEEAETGRYRQRWNAYHEYEYTIENLEYGRSAVQNLLDVSARVVLLIFAATAIMHAELSVGTMIMLVTYQGLIFAPLAQLNNTFSRTRRVVRRSAHLFQIAKEQDPLRDAPGAAPLPELRKEIALENVTFTYGHLPALTDISCRLKTGTTTALVGRSGSGKTTLAMLLMRFYDPASGRITWDGMDLRHARRASLRQRIALVPQDTSLFNRSIAENIAYGRPDAPMEEIIMAAKRAHAHDFITKMPGGYSAIIGERGVRLSGGQRQRIAIARALLLNPSLLILDESTSHLDSESEEGIKQSIRELHHKTTQVIIAHRLSTVLHADQIIVLDRGRIVACGTHAALLRSSPVYRQLCSLQFRKSVAAGKRTTTTVKATARR